ncbi:hypothetical protein Raf01_08980 [Rugosimonospora africana]|uniref:Uncharacterized protein n=1 Tax=Rugosimonospora africana TaxID=556532 RepID=A0A8J3QPD5_9ACTN|nr:hypothetical protein Raf01_08980 [Rugosimonospora africana]
METVKILENRYERPSVSTVACAPAHEWLVGRLGVQDAVKRPRLAKFQDQLSQRKSVQLQGTLPQALGTNGSTAKATGMAKSPASAGANASGVPPRGRPV